MEEARASLAASPPPQPVHRETLLNSSSSFPRSVGVARGEPAPRIVPQPADQTNSRPSPLLAILFTPFHTLFRIFSGSLSLVGYLFPFLPRLLSNLAPGSSPARSSLNTTGRRPLNPRDTAARFAREFEEEYGAHSLHFFDNGYAQAYDVAKKDLKFLLVVLISPEHDDTSSFIRETLLSEEVVNYINDPQNNILLWAGNVQDSEAYQVSTALNCSKFPFSALIVHTPQGSTSSMSTIARITGLVPPSAYVPKLQNAISQQSAVLDRVRATRAEQDATRTLRHEQNSAYERSLTQDRERARQRREAEAERQKEEQEAKAVADAEEIDRRNLEQWRIWRAQSITPEPESDTKNVTRVSIRMTSGERVVRKFASSSTMEELYAYVECYDILQSPNPPLQPISEPQNYAHEYQFQLVSPMPRAVYSLDSPDTVGSTIGRSANLIVEPISPDED